MITFASLTAGEDKIAVIGLGYVGLPLAVHLSKYFRVVGFDLKPDRIAELTAGHDRTLEVDDAALADADIHYTNQEGELAACRLIIVAVPTPIDAHHIPDLGPVRNAAVIVGRQLQKGSCVVFESTVYPGVTEEICVPILAELSGLEYSQEFTVGYSPERINPGDKVHTLDKIIKIVSGSDAATTRLLAAVYGRIVTAGIHQAASIKIAEAAKVIENTQRDLNIALMNELALIFDRLGIDTMEVLEAAGTKWNFLPFRPGLVGGHCIGVDPYYLTFKAESIGYHPEIILAGRRINDNMGKYIAERVVKMLIAEKKQVYGSKVAILGITFKEDVPDLRNTRVIDIIAELKEYGIEIIVHDPLADAAEALHYYHVALTPIDQMGLVDAVILAVAHRSYRELSLARIAALCNPSQTPILVDVKSLFSPQLARENGVAYWRL